jgi:hypothetical protein
MRDMALRRALPVLLLTLAGLVGLDAAPAAAAATYTVTTNLDTVNGGDGVLSLREALNSANTDGTDSTINLLAGQVHTLTLCNAGDPGELENVSGDLNSANGSGDLTLVGNGATIDQACPGERVLRQVGDDLRIEGLTITGGDLDITEATDGGGITAASGGPVTLVDSVVRGNSAQSGGGIAANSVVIDNSLITDNEAAVGGAVYLFGSGLSATVTDSSLVGNTANNIPGIDFTNPGVATLTNVTLGGSTANVANFSVGGELNLSDGNATLIHTTIVGAANETAVRVGGTLTAFGTVIDGGAGQSCAFGGTTVSQGYNIESNTDLCGFHTGTDVVQAFLGPFTLADNGGAGPSYLPAAGSIIDNRIPAASCSPTVTTDARGVSRPSGTGCEPGATERPPRFAADGQIRNSAQSTFAGNNVVNLTGAGQTRSQNRAVGRKAIFFTRVQNDGDSLGDYTVRGPAGTNRFAVRYFRGATGQNITAAVVAGTQRFDNVAPGATRVVRIEVTPRAVAPRNATITLPVRFTSVDDTTKKDVVKATVKRV